MEKPNAIGWFDIYVEDMDRAVRDFQGKKRSTITLVYTKYLQTISRGQATLLVLNG